MHFHSGEVSVGAAVGYADLYGGNGEKFAKLFQHRLNEASSFEVSSVYHTASSLQEEAEKLTPCLESLAFMTLLSVKDRIPLSQDLIYRLRSLYINFNNKFIENSEFNVLPVNIRDQLSSAIKELATSICMADIANSQKIGSILSRLNSNV